MSPRFGGTEVNPFTEGVLCNKVTHYFPDFVHGENRLRYPRKRVGAKGEGTFERSHVGGGVQHHPPPVRRGDR